MAASTAAHVGKRKALEGQSSVREASSAANTRAATEPHRKNPGASAPDSHLTSSCADHAASRASPAAQQPQARSAASIMLPGANTAARKNRSHKPGKNTATGTEISAIAKIRSPSATHPKTTAPVTIITL